MNPDGTLDSTFGTGGITLFTPPSADKPLTVVTYDAGPPQAAYLYPLAVGGVLPDAELFLMPGRYVNVPLEATYQATWKEFPAALKGLLET